MHCFSPCGVFSGIRMQSHFFWWWWCDILRNSRVFFLWRDKANGRTKPLGQFIDLENAAIFLYWCGWHQEKKSSPCWDAIHRVPIRGTKPLDRLFHLENVAISCWCGWLEEKARLFLGRLIDWLIGQSCNFTGFGHNEKNTAMSHHVASSLN
jgi:hypothetical protein